MKEITRTIASTVIVLIICAASAWGIGTKENSLGYVDMLITNQRYDEAILFLTDFIKKNPTLFDAAQHRMQRITKIRSAYNTSASTLIEVLKSDPLNQGKKLAIIAELESYERAPNPAIQEFVSKTKELALFTYNQARFEEIMEQGRTLIEKRKFTDAAKIYESGFSLYRPEFKDAGFEQAVVDDAFQRVELVSDEIDRFAGYAIAMNEAFVELASSYRISDDHAYATAWNNAVSISAELSALRNRVVNHGRALEAAFVDIAANDPKITDNSFLPFAFRLVLGRRNGNNFEGIVGAIDTQWISTLGGAQAALDEILQAESAIAKTAYDTTDWATAVSAFHNMSKNAVRKTALLSLWSHYAVSDLIERATAMGQTALSLKGTAYLASVHTARTARLCASLAAAQATIETESRLLVEYHPETDRQADRSAVLGTFEMRRTAFRETGNKIEILKSKAAENAIAMRAWTGAGFGSPYSQAESDLLDSMISEALQKALNMEIKSVASAAAWEYGLLLAKSKQASTLIAEAKNNLYGLQSSDPVLQGLVLHYPVKAFENFDVVDKLENGIRKESEAFLASYSSYPDFISESSAVAHWSTLTATLAAQAQDDQAEAKKLSLIAREQKNLADYNREEAERRIAELKTALKSNNFIAAKDRLSLARDRFQASLEFEYNERLGMESDKILAELAAMVRKAENDLVVADSRLFLNRCKNLYLEGEFEQAESALLQAKMTWAITNSKPDFEIEYWLRLVKNALLIQTDRSIPVTSSLFPEASQTMALARRYFEEGSAFLAKRDKTAAVNSFTQAKQKISEVKSAFPLSQEASILELEIDQLSDPAAFAKKFLQLFNSAKNRIEANNDLNAAYNDLKDLESIQPQYRGLKALREQAEILIGFKPPPPDSKAIASARDLVKSAQQLLESGQTAQFQNALEILEKAMLLDPGLDAMGSLKDRIAVRLGGDAAMVLPSVAETFYKEAAKYFEKGEFPNARDKLTHLIDVFPEGQSMKKVIDLDERLDDMGY